MKNAPNYYYNVTKRMLLLVGQWPYQERKSRLFRVSLITAMTFSMTVPQVGKIIQCDGNAQCITLVIPSCILMVLITVKVYTCQFNSNKVCQYKNLYYALTEKCLVFLSKIIIYGFL
ncbi:uncharacterized protein LOC105428172 [Pogonomyrmex barbatus]|uniref:Uncharacterized protein LOC105428172 n=1 Tax=Pogonomyrmex barbatus TaxID=144034 RepID=A0A6I9WCS8_9HYME|nr:uncharacterized protein LOC105428172 [Pogonomyrmex barbatus]